MFTEYPSYPRYRSIKLGDRGADVYALQTALAGCRFDVGPLDGIAGKQTGAAIRTAQNHFELGMDGLAGGQTQRALALELGRHARDLFSLAVGALNGQMEHESGFRLGNYSPIRLDGSYDAGVCQMNTAHTPAQEGFNVPDSIHELAKVIRIHYDLFEGVKSLRRRWGLAQGAWNAPAFACFLAKAEGATRVTTNMTLRPSDSARETFEAYIEDVTVHLSV